jgi:epsilon-lactone hydrolase
VVVTHRSFYWYHRIGRVRTVLSVAGAWIALLPITLNADSPPAAPENKPTVTDDGTVVIPSLAVPLSSYMSDEARRRFTDQVREGRTQEGISKGKGIAAQRAWVDAWYRRRVDRGVDLYPVTIEERRMAGVRVHVVTPKTSGVEKDRILINVHGGGFRVGGVWGGLAESIPIAVTAGVQVVTIDYRMAPEYKFPAASEDVASVYAELLKKFAPANIGIYGSSSGGVLTAQAIAWFQKKGLPRPGAIGIFSAGIDKMQGGDSLYISRMLDVSLELPRSARAPNREPKVSSPTYLSEANHDDPLVWPANDSEVLKEFPPTLLISGTRDATLSQLLSTHRSLVTAGVDADLHVWEGMGHNFLVEMDLPESKDAYATIARFFNKHLSREWHTANRP